MREGFGSAPLRPPPRGTGTLRGATLPVAGQRTTRKAFGTFRNDAPNAVGQRLRYFRRRAVENVHAYEDLEKRLIVARLHS